MLRSLRACKYLLLSLQLLTTYYNLFILNKELTSSMHEKKIENLTKKKIDLKLNDRLTTN